MGKYWTVGIAWGFMAWIPYYANLPSILKITLGFPVILAGYLTIICETIVGPIPNSLSFTFTLPAGMALSWLIYKTFSLGKGRGGKVLRKEVG